MVQATWHNPIFCGSNRYLKLKLKAALIRNRSVIDIDISSDFVPPFRMAEMWPRLGVLACLDVRPLIVSPADSDGC